MYGKTTNAHHYMARTGSHATKGSRRGFVDAESGVNPTSLLTPEQRRDSLKRQHAALGRLRDDLKSGRTRGTKAEWERLGQDMQEIQNELSALNKSIDPTRNHHTFDAWFNTCAKSMLTPADYARVAEEARRRMSTQDAAHGGRDDE